jgi:hypothetical protein
MSDIDHKTAVLAFRLHIHAMQQLRAMAEARGESMAEIIRESLYVACGIDELRLDVGSVCTSPVAPRVIHPPR